MEVYGNDAPCLRTVSTWTAKIRKGDYDLNDKPRSGRKKILDSLSLEEPISSLLDKYPFASAKFISIHFNISYQTTKNILTKYLGYKKYHLRWVPYKLSENHKKLRIKYSTKILGFLKQNEKTFFKNIITGDESWFFFQYDYKFQYGKERSKIEYNIKPNFSLKKAMITIFFSGSGFLLVDALPKGAKFNSDYFCDTILEGLKKEIHRRRPKMLFKNIFLHMDNAKPHLSIKSREKISSLGLSLLKHPPYSPDLAPSDFWLFGFLKEKLKGSSFETREELVCSISKILTQIPKQVIFSVFINWINRLKYVIKNEGDYYQD